MGLLLSTRRAMMGSTTYPRWWDPNNAGLSVIGAWRAINTPGSVWGAGPATYAESLVDLSGNGNTLTEGNGAVPWAAATGWGFVAAAVQYFETGLTPANDQSWSVFLQYANLAVNSWLLGMLSGADRGLAMRRQAASVQYWNGASQAVAPVINTGNLGVVGNQGYRNGVADGGAIAAWAGAAGHTVWIGGLNNAGVLALPTTGDFSAVVLYDGGEAAVQAEALAIATAMAAL